MNWTTLSFGPDGEPCEPEFTHRDSPTRPPLTIRVRDGRVDCGSGGSIYYGRLVVRGINLHVAKQTLRFGANNIECLFVLAWVEDETTIRRFIAIQAKDVGQTIPAVFRNVFKAWLCEQSNPELPEFRRSYASWVDWNIKITSQL